MNIEGLEVKIYNTMHLTFIPYMTGYLKYSTEREDIPFYYCAEFMLEGFRFLVGNFFAPKWKRPNRVVNTLIGVGASVKNDSSIDIVVHNFLERYKSFKKNNPSLGVQDAVANWAKALDKRNRDIQKILYPCTYQSLLM